ncbi:hypothetical protein [Maridesulfovibrio sp.]|uniref:hypothetical protein n=1 Tax=Maridesulfovibrio sp. TaxID=2795000 RepID=UPI002A1888F6|nr:hypothetical protein [Maridesulfovibrio sp.]
MAIVFVFCSVISASAADMFGCIINEAPVAAKGTIQSAQTTINFNVHRCYVWCITLPEGEYSVISDNFSFHKHFSVSSGKTVGRVGKQNLHWVVKIKKQDLK